MRLQLTLALSASVAAGAAGTIAACAGGTVEETVPAATSSSGPGGGASGCPEGQSSCDEGCFDLQSDSAHCGGCNTMCVNGETCSDGVCGLACNGGTVACGDRCIDPLVDPANCGTCDNACMPGEDCNGGGCCPFGQHYCGGSCTDILANDSHCGGCDIECTGADMQCIAGVCETILASCNEYITNNPNVTDGVYVIDPDGGGGVASFDMYCDMTTDGGGWSLVLAYAHVGGQNLALVAGDPPLDPMVGYAHMSLARVLELPAFNEVRLYCDTSAHTRTMHFKTTSGAVNYFRGLTGNAVVYWTGGFVPLANHSSNLPGSANAAFNQSGDDRMTEFPFYTGGAYHWGIRGSGSRWECDDFSGGAGQTTLHQIWIR